MITRLDEREKCFIDIKIVPEKKHKIFLTLRSKSAISTPNEITAKIPHCEIEILENEKNKTGHLSFYCLRDLHENELCVCVCVCV
jgi:hypothetical protein